MRTKLYDTVKTLLETQPSARDSDKRLIWCFYYETGVLNKNGKLSFVEFSKAASCESITRARRKVQENHPELRATKGVKSSRDGIANKYKGMHVYHQDDQGKLYE